MKESADLRKHVVELLRGSHAHVDFDGAVADFPSKLRGKKMEGAAHTGWQLLEHLRIAQWDIVEFTRDPTHVSPAFPDGYWPKTVSPPTSAAWNNSIRRFRADLKTMVLLVADKKVDLFTRIPHGSGQTVLREALLLADHNAYHIGQMVALRRMLGAWNP